MKIPQSTIDEINNRVRIEDIVSTYVRLERRGSRLWGLSPFKAEKTPSFTVTPERNAYYCFSTQKGGGVFQFVMEMENLSFPEAVRLLADRVGIQIPDDGNQQPDAFLEHAKHRKALLELYSRVAAGFAHILSHSPAAAAARAYVERRGIVPAALLSFRLGYCPRDGRWLHRFLLEKNYSAQFLEQSGLFSRRTPDWCIFADRLIFPIFNATGEVIAFGGRTLSDNGPKYINSPETMLYKKKEQLYGLSHSRTALRSGHPALLVEGYVDVIALHQHGFESAVAPLGTAFGADQARVLKRFTDHLELMFDGDGAGIAATAKAAIVCEAHELLCTVAEMPAGVDPGDFVAQKGLHNLKKIVGSPVSILDFLLRRAIDQFHINSPEGKALVLQNVAPFLSSIKSSVRFQASVGVVADVLGVGPDIVTADLRRFSASRSHDAVNSPGNLTTSDADGSLARQNAVFGTSAGVGVSNSSVEQPRRPMVQGSGRVVGSDGTPVSVESDLRLMLAVATNRQFFERVRNSVKVDDLLGHDARMLFVALEEAYRLGIASVDGFLARVDDPKLRSIVAKALATEEYTIATERIVADGIEHIKKRSLAERRKFIEAELRKTASVVGDSRSPVMELLREKMYLDSILTCSRVDSEGHADA